LRDSYRNRLHAVIPGGAHTYSRGDDQFPSNAPAILENGNGCKVFCPNGKEYIDFGMGLRSVSIGYAEPQINAAVLKAIEKGNNLTRATTLELEAAELLVSMIDSAEMVKFCKNGSNATTAAIKLARAYTGKNIIARCFDDPFLSFDDWFIGSTNMKRGIPKANLSQTKLFKYNDIDSLRLLMEQHAEELACVIMEPASQNCPNIQGSFHCCEESPCSKFLHCSSNFLKEVEQLCKQYNVIFILDETITGFRWNMRGAQKLYGINPDLSTFGKSMANGFSVAALVGRKELMELGGIDIEGMQRTFLLSSTHGAEMTGMAAFIATQKFMIDNRVIDHLWNTGFELKKIIKDAIIQSNMSDLITISGPAISPVMHFRNSNGDVNLNLKTLFMQEMLNCGVLMPWISICYRHDSSILKKVKSAAKHALEICKHASDDNIASYLRGKAAKPVFREYN
jgi:glutamate-1-semialdehyde 2,1-aminomutase